MADYDPTDFVDDDFQSQRTAAPGGASAGAGTPLRAPTREEVDSKVALAQQKLADLKRAQEELERERAALEETRRRQAEFQTGRQELVHNLTRGLGLLEEAEFNARRDAEQMSKTLADLRDALAKVEAVHEETWTKDTFDVELTRGLTAIENARMEWNSARLKFAVLSGPSPAVVENSGAGAGAPEALPLAGRGFGEWCKLGLALNWPVAVALLLVLAALLAILFRR